MPNRSDELGLSFHVPTIPTDSDFPEIEGDFFPDSGSGIID